MLALLRQPNFARLWWGSLISLTGNRVLSVALPFYVYQQTGSTLATATMVIATIIPSILLSTVAGVMIDRWDRRRVMIVANLILAVVLLPLLAVGSTGWIWLVYLVAFAETSIAIFFGLAENALLPQIVAPDQLLSANSLNSLNDTFARLIGPALGGLLLAVWGLESIVLFDCISYLLAGLLVFTVSAPPEQTRAVRPPAASTDISPTSFWREWTDGATIVRREQLIAVLFVVIGLTTLGGTMMDPLYAPFVHAILQESSATFGWLLTLQGMGGIIGGVVIGRFAARIKPAYLFSSSAIAAGIILAILFQSVALSVVSLLFFVVGIPSVGARVGLQTLLQESVTDAYRGRVGGLLTMVGSLLELLSVSFAGVMGDTIGIVPLLSIAAGMTVLAGMTGILLLPRAIRSAATSS